MKVPIKNIPHGTKFKIPSGETVIKWNGLPAPFNAIVFQDEYDDEPRLREVNDGSTVEMTTFGELTAGSHFEAGGNRYIKTNSEFNGLNCINLATGWGYRLEGHAYVTNVKISS